MTYQIRVERGRMKIYDTRKKLLYWLDDRASVEKIVFLLNEKSFRQSFAPDSLKAGDSSLPESVKVEDTLPAEGG